MKINRHGITLSLISFLIAGAPVFAQDGSSWASPGTVSASETDSTAVGAWANAGKAGTALGSASYAHAPFSTSVGMSAYVNPEASNGVAVGSWASADALNSVALGTVHRQCTGIQWLLVSSPVQPVKMKSTSDMTQVSQNRPVRVYRIKPGFSVVSVMVHGTRMQPLSGN